MISQFDAATLVCSALMALGGLASLAWSIYIYYVNGRMDHSPPASQDMGVSIIWSESHPISATPSLEPLRGAHASAEAVRSRSDAYRDVRQDSAL